MTAAVAAALWVLTCLRWFDVARPWRPGWLEWIHPAPLAAAALAAAVSWVLSKRAVLFPSGEEDTRGGLALVTALAIAFRLPLLWHGAAGYVTADGALSGIVALRLHAGLERFVFVPSVAYSGSLKSHLAAVLMSVIEPARAFALASVLFYALFVAAVYRLAALASPGAAARRWPALAAGLYLAFAPAFVTRYSLSNDGNYVEVLALGTWALVFVVRWVLSSERPPALGLAAGVLLGLAFWCHILAVIHAAVAVVVVAVALYGRARGPKTFAALGAGWVLGAAPAVLWNAANGWESLRYLVPGGTPVGAIEEGPGLFGRAWGMAAGQWPVLLGYDHGYPASIDAALAFATCVAVAAVLYAFGSGVVWAARGDARSRVLVLFTAANLAVALFALPLVPGNPRYLLFLAAPIAVFLGRALDVRWGRPLMAVLVAFGAAGSWGQAAAALRSDAEWRGFVAALEREHVAWCYTDFHLAARIDFLSGERVVCSSKLGPTATEYFADYRSRVESAPSAALIAVNGTAADKLERRLARLGVGYERRDWMKPVLLRLSRKVEPEELFPR
jgi:hypothetical protein